MVINGERLFKLAIYGYISADKSGEPIGIGGNLPKKVQKAL